MKFFADVPITPLEYILGTDRRFAIHVFTDTTLSVSRDVTGMDVNFMVKRRFSDDDADAILDINASVSGVFSASPDPNVNLQRVYALVEDSMTDEDSEMTPGEFHWEAKRMDAGAEVPLAMGPFTAKRGVHGA